MLSIFLNMCYTNYMKTVIQRVKNAALYVNGEKISEIGNGLAVYFGVEKGDSEKEADYAVRKISNMRIFSDENGKMNLSVKDVSGEILLISQFTLLANTTHGNRPDFLNAEQPDKANELYLYAKDKFSAEGIPVKTGVFGADMVINQVNDGPVTIIL